MTTTIHTIYTDRVTRFTAQKEEINKQLRSSSLLRLLIFVIAGASIYWFWSQLTILATILIVCIIIFLFLVSRHATLIKKRDYHVAMGAINEDELLVLDRDFHHRDAGEDFASSTHEYSQDIDLYGKGSLFQYINRCVTIGGRSTLSRKLNSNDLSQIIQKQEAIIELSGYIDFRQSFTATATLLQQKETPETILKWLKNYEPFVPNVMRWLPWLLFGISLFSVLGYIYADLSGYIVGAVFFTGLIITRKYLKGVNALSGNVSTLEHFFGQYGQLIMAIENKQFNSVLLNDIKSKVITTEQPASERFSQLGAAIGRLDQRNNMLFGFLANGFGLWDLKQVHTIEKWLYENGRHVEHWISAVAEIEALNSLGTFAYNHDHYKFPMILENDDSILFQATDLNHVLLNPEKSIGNSITIEKEQFFIITGANMAGKSTFLRTVSTAIVMANMGLPLSASHVSYSPIKLVTSMRTTDSLTDDASYFFSELKRLKFIVDLVENERYFIVLDEILKGTNSQDKANGSRDLIKKLSLKKASGIIATHDLSLTEVSQEFASVINIHFDATIIEDELSFDYLLKQGVATTMNASFLLRKMGIV